MTQVTYAVYVVIGILLVLMSIQDIKKREISNVYIAILTMVCVCSGVFFRQLSWMDMLSGCSIGLCLVGISVLTQEQIGIGDGLVVGAIGLLMGGIKTITLLSMASLIMAALSIILIMLRRGTRKMKLPFLPAISVGYVLCLLM